MAKQIIKSQNAIVAVSNNTSSFSTSNIDLNLINNVQNTSFSIAFPHQKSKQLGSQNYVIDNTFTQPDVELSLSYIPDPKLENELYTNFIKTVNSYTKPVQALSGVLPYNSNFLVITNPDQGKDALSSITIDGSSTNLTGFEAASFGNCYLTSYGLSYSINSLPVVTTTYIGSNAKFENLTGADMQSPAINLVSGNNSNVGQLEFAFDNGIKNPRVLLPNGPHSSVNFENLQVGGQKLSGNHSVQSVDMSLGIERVSNYGLGSDYSYDRKAQMPANGSFNISSLVSGYENGNITGILPNEETYNFDLVLGNPIRNLCAYSEDFSVWSLQSSPPMSILSSNNDDPKGGNNATLFKSNSTDPYALLFTSSASDVKYMFIEEGKPYTLSAFAKGKGSSIGKSFRLQIWFGVGTATGPTSVKLFTLTDQWQRFELTAIPTGSGSIAIRFDIVDPASSAVASDEVFVFGVQFEQSSSASAYQKNYANNQAKKIKYSVSNARLESYSSSIPVNGIMSLDASFTFPINESLGLTLSGTTY